MTRAVDLVVIGGSAGSIEVLQRVLARLPRRFAPAHAGLKVKLAEDKEPIVGGTINVASSDYHLLVGKGPHFRPFAGATGALFETVAEAYGERLMGVILSGANPGRRGRSQGRSGRGRNSGGAFAGLLRMHSGEQELQDDR